MRRLVNRLPITRIKMLIARILCLTQGNLWGRNASLIYYDQGTGTQVFGPAPGLQLLQGHEVASLSTRDEG